MHWKTSRIMVRVGRHVCRRPAYPFLQTQGDLMRFLIAAGCLGNRYCFKRLGTQLFHFADDTAGNAANQLE